MNKILKTFGPVLLLAALSTISFGQIKSMGVGKSVVGVSMDPKKFNPQISTKVVTSSVEKEHEMRFSYPAGNLNNLVAGGTLQDTRIS